MSKQINGFITWIRTFLDDIYAPKGSGGSDLDIDLVPKSENDDGVICFSGGLTYDLDKVYPVGSIYMSVNSANPSTLFGGTWQKIEGRFLLASGTTSGEDPNPNNTYTLGDTDGEKTHTLTTAQIPSHTHGSKTLTGTMRVIAFSGGANPSGIVSFSGSNAKDRTMSSGSNFGAQTYSITATHTHDSVGSGQAHNNMPPYLVVNVWERTA